MNEYPRIWAVYCFATGEIEYSTTRYTAAQGFVNALPDTVRDKFQVVRYDANESYKQTR